MFILIYRLREFLLFMIANRFELRCQSTTAEGTEIQDLSLLKGSIMQKFL